MGKWIPPNAPLSEEYWQVLLRDGKHGKAAPTASQTGLGEKSTTESAKRSKKPAIDERWEEARRLMEKGEVLKLPIVGRNRGGLLVGWNGIEGFVPASHLLDLSSSTDEKTRQAELRRFIGTNLRLKIIELDQEHDRFILSERATQVEKGQSDELLESLRPGDVRQGRVTSLCSFGVFVDLGGFEGLVHISELSWGRVDRPGDLLEPGQEVEVYVLNVDPDRERVGLSLKRLQPNPWRGVKERYQVGQMVEGVVSHVVDFGAFVQVEEGLEGLIHVSELTDGNPRHPRDVVREGDTVTAEVLNVDGQRCRMGLRLQRVNRKLAQG